jgi:hypothetical protein
MRVIPFPHVTAEDIELVEQALRGLADRYQQTARRQTNPVLRQGFEKRAEECERRAYRMKQGSGSGQIRKRLRSLGVRQPLVRLFFCRSGAGFPYRFRTAADPHT